MSDPIEVLREYREGVVVHDGDTLTDLGYDQAIAAVVRLRDAAQALAQACRSGQCVTGSVRDEWQEFHSALAPFAQEER